jgi:hypothetical protein
MRSSARSKRAFPITRRKLTLLRGIGFQPMIHRQDADATKAAALM